MRWPLSKWGGGGQNFCRWGHKFVPFGTTRIAYRNHQVDADLKKRPLRQIGLLFSEFFVDSKKKRKKGNRANILKLPQGKKFLAIMGSWGGILGNLGGAAPWPPLVAALLQLSNRIIICRPIEGVMAQDRVT